MNREQMLELADTCEAAGEGDRAIDLRIAEAIGWQSNIVSRARTWSPGNDDAALLADVINDGYLRGLPRYTASLDAAMQLVPADRFVGELNQCDVGGDWYARVECHHDVFHDATAPTAALALTAAALRARASLMDKD